MLPAWLVAINDFYALPSYHALRINPGLDEQHGRDLRDVNGDWHHHPLVVAWQHAHVANGERMRRAMVERAGHARVATVRASDATTSAAPTTANTATSSALDTSK